MVFESPTLKQRSLSATIASIAVGVALGVVAVAGANIFSDAGSAPAGATPNPENSVLGSPEYGSRQ